MTDEVYQNFIDKVSKESEEKITGIITKEEIRKGNRRKIDKIKKIEEEFIEMGGNINNKYNQLKTFRLAN